MQQHVGVFSALTVQQCGVVIGTVQAQCDGWQGGALLLHLKPLCCMSSS